MRMLTAFTVALSLSAAGQVFTGQAFAGEHHAPSAHAPTAQASAAQASAAPATRAEAKTDLTNHVGTESPMEKQMHRQEIVTQAATSAMSISNSRPQSTLKILGK